MSPSGAFGRNQRTVAAASRMGAADVGLVSSGNVQLEITRIFIDPAVDPDSGDVFGTILRVEGVASS